MDEKMDKARRNQIGYAAYKATLRKDYAFRDIKNAKRQIGNVINEPEFKNINLTKEEAQQFFLETLDEMYGEQTSYLRCNPPGKN